MNEGFFTLAWREGKVVVLDQRRLPLEEVYNEYDSVEGVAEAIRTMVVRGAPAIGCAAAMGVALAANRAALGGEKVAVAVEAACRTLLATRPTAVNLAWAIERMRRVAARHGSEQSVASRLEREAQALLEEDLAANRAIGLHGASLLGEEVTVLTHCNAGALATAGYGTALGVVRAAVEQGKRVRVLADETRPLLQGARLTAWELSRDGIDVTLITDSMAGLMMRRGEVDVALVGADRIASNGDAANKIGTYTVAILCKEHGLPFYVAAPFSTVDLSTPTGEEIPIEERDPREVTTLAGVQIAPRGVSARSPAFDVTPARLITAIVTDRGVAGPPYGASLAALAARA